MVDEARGVVEIEKRARSLYGAAATRPVSGVLHVLSAVETADGRLHVIRIGPHAPKSACDFFVLNYWRAHADAIVTSAEVVRQEPALRHALQGPHASELAAFRKLRLQKAEAPICAVLTRSGNLPLAHDMWTDNVRYCVLTGPERESSLQGDLGGRARVVGLPDLDAVRAVAWLRQEGAKDILIEAGPSTANALYGATPRVDHLLVSHFVGMYDPAAVGGELVPPVQLFAGKQRVACSERTEESGPWRFERWDSTPSAQ